MTKWSVPEGEYKLDNNIYYEVVGAGSPSTENINIIIIWIILLLKCLRWYVDKSAYPPLDIKRTVEVHVYIIAQYIYIYRLLYCRSSKIATPFTSRTDLSTIQVNLTVSEEAKKDLLEGDDELFNMVDEVV